MKILFWETLFWSFLNCTIWHPKNYPPHPASCIPCPTPAPVPLAPLTAAPLAPHPVPHSPGSLWDGERRDSGRVGVVLPFERRVHRQLAAEDELSLPVEAAAQPAGAAPRRRRRQRRCAAHLPPLHQLKPLHGRLRDAAGLPPWSELFAQLLQQSTVGPGGPGVGRLQLAELGPVGQHSGPSVVRLVWVGDGVSGRRRRRGVRHLDELQTPHLCDDTPTSLTADWHSGGGGGGDCCQYYQYFGLVTSSGDPCGVLNLAAIWT